MTFEGHSKIPIEWTILVAESSWGTAKCSSSERTLKMGIFTLPTLPRLRLGVTLRGHLYSIPNKRHSWARNAASFLSFTLMPLNRLSYSFSCHLGKCLQAFFRTFQPRLAPIVSISRCDLTVLPVSPHRPSHPQQTPFLLGGTLCS